MKTDLTHIPGDLPGAGALLALMAQDKQVVDGRLRFILARGIGKAVVSEDLAAEVVRTVLAAAYLHADRPNQSGRLLLRRMAGFYPAVDPRHPTRWGNTWGTLQRHYQRTQGDQRMPLSVSSALAWLHATLQQNPERLDRLETASTEAPLSPAEVLRQRGALGRA